MNDATNDLARHGRATRREMFAVISVVAVVASLVFVGFEIQQNTAAFQDQARQELVALNQGWLELLSDPRNLDLYTRAWILEEELGPLETAHADMMMLVNIARLELVFLRYEEGLVDETALASYGSSNKEAHTLFDSMRFQAFWSDWRSHHHPAFVEYFEGLATAKDDATRGK